MGVLVWSIMNLRPIDVMEKKREQEAAEYEKQIMMIKAGEGEGKEGKKMKAKLDQQKAKEARRGSEARGGRKGEGGKE